MGFVKNVLWVCFGNTARSAYALGISEWLKKTKYKGDLERIDFDSAGFVNVFKTAQPEVIERLKAKDIDFTDFRGKIMDENLLEKQDLILVMESMHLKRLRKKFASVKDIDKKSYLILEFAGERENLDITDPVNFDQEIYNQILDSVERGVVKSIEKIIQINKSEVKSLKK
jgi:protein-tyrosine-phosphatase